MDVGKEKRQRNRAGYRARPRADPEEIEIERERGMVVGPPGEKVNAGYGKRKSNRGSCSSSNDGRLVGLLLDGEKIFSRRRGWHW